MYYSIESKVGNNWVKISGGKKYSAETAANHIAYLIEDCDCDEAANDYRAVPAN